jgi:hypothetical protein
MATLQASAIADLVASTLRDLGRGKFSQIAQELQCYEMMSKWLKTDKVQFDSGYGIQRTLLAKLGNAASHVGLYEEDSVNVSDLLTTMNVPWRHAKTQWAYEYRETLMNRGKAMIVKIVEPRRIGALIDLAQELEEKAWAAPSSANTTDPYGVPYFIVKNATDGFNGGLPSDHSTVANVNLTTYPTYKNYTWQYTDVTKTDLLKDMRTAKRKTAWKPPVPSAASRGIGQDRYRIYVNETTINALELLGEAQNENLGRDLASMDGEMTFHKIPIVWVPYLDNDTTQPVYLIDHSTFYPVCLKGDYLRDTGPQQAPKQHNVYESFVDLSYNFICVDRRRNAVGYI